MPAIIAKDAAQQLYRAIFAKLTGDEELRTMIGGTPEEPRVYQSAVDFDSAAALKDKTWITFNSVSDHPSEAEQTQDIRDIILDVHIWRRGPGSDNAEEAELRVRELLDNAIDLGGLAKELLVLKCLAVGYFKTYEAQGGLWHITSTYDITCMAQRQV